MVISLNPYVRLTTHTHILVGHVTRYSQELVTRLVAALERTSGKRRIARNRLPLGSTRGQSRVPIVVLSLPSDRQR